MLKVIIVLLCALFMMACNSAKKPSNDMMVYNLNPSEEPLQETPIWKRLQFP